MVGKWIRAAVVAAAAVGVVSVATPSEAKVRLPSNREVRTTCTVQFTLRPSSRKCGAAGDVRPGIFPRGAADQTRGGGRCFSMYGL